MSKDKINAFEFTSLISSLSSSAIMGSGFIFLYTECNKSSVLSMFIGLIISFIFLLLIFKTFNTLPEKTLVQKSQFAFPKIISYILNAIFGIAFLILGSLTLYRLTSFFNTQFLTDIPKIFLGLVLVLVPFYACTKNIETISRFSSISIFICLFTFLFNFLSLTPQIEISNIIPIIDSSWKNIILSSVIFSLLFSGPIFSLLIVPKSSISNPKKLKRNVIIFYLISGVILLLINFATLGVLGIDMVKTYTYPIYMVLKKIQIFEFINSVENITILIWFFFLIITSSIYLSFSKNIFIEIFKIKNKWKSFLSLFLCAFAITVPELYFANQSSLDKPSLVYYPITFFIFFYVFSIVFLILVKYKKK